MASTWFCCEFGFDEKREGRRFAAVREQFECTPFNDEVVVEEGADLLLVSRANGRSFHVGPFETPSLLQLRSRLSCLLRSDSDLLLDLLGAMTFTNISGCARSLHLDPCNEGAVFQVASQFNCLEMVGPGETPENGVTQYFRDRTQGPVCAMACPAATVFRNYFWDGRGQAGGSARQLDTTRDVARLLGNRENDYWQMQNGYLLPTRSDAMRDVGERLASEPCPIPLNEETGVAFDSGDPLVLRDAVRALMRVGVHWDTESERGHNVCQVFSSAVPCNYTKSTRSGDWAPFASTVLEATFEATLTVAAILALRRRRRVTVFLTCVGGGAFGNRAQWIVNAVDRALSMLRGMPIDVKLVHFRTIPRSDWGALERKFGSAEKKKTKEKK